MAKPRDGLLDRLVARARGVPTERDWRRCVVLEPRSAPRLPKLVSHGAGLSFSPRVLDKPPKPLDSADPAVSALVEYLEGEIAGWRLLARSDTEALFGQGDPPELATAVVREDPKRGAWSCVSKTNRRALRATRDGIRASSWHLDDAVKLSARDTVLRICVTEQTVAGGRRADGRVLRPDLHVNEHELVLTMYVRPEAGFQMRRPNPETPVRVALAHPVGSRKLIDGAVYE